jgi:hypothetical protein
LTWAIGSVVGSVLIILPDSDARVFSFSRTHGPSTVDLIGMTVMVGAWLPLVALIWCANATPPAWTCRPCCDRSAICNPREAVRALADAVLEVAGPTLADDATLLILDWYGGHRRGRRSSAGADSQRAIAALPD